MKQRIRDTIADHARDLRRFGYANARIQDMIQNVEAALDINRPRTTAKAAVRRMADGFYTIRQDEVALTDTEVWRLAARNDCRDGQDVRYVAYVSIIELRERKRP